LRDSDTNDGKKIASIRRKLADKIKKLIQEQEFGRVHILASRPKLFPAMWAQLRSARIAEFVSPASHIGAPALQALQRVLCLRAKDR
jgi:hypothetical protein